MPMKKFLLYFFLIVILLNNVSCECSENQIDINTASLEELDKIVYVGSVTAERIISMRPFNFVDELINVSGIGETKLNAIKNENLACVENFEIEKEIEKDYEEKKDNEQLEEKSTENEEFLEEEENLENEIVPEEKSVEETKEFSEIKKVQTIKLNSKDIKNDNPIEENKKENLITGYASFGLVVICISLIILLFLQKRKNGLE